MTPVQFNTFTEAFIHDMKEILLTKGHDYTGGSDDRLRNFKEIAGLIGVSPMVVWFTYFMKHVDSLATFVKLGELKSEPPAERFKDVANYALLGAALAMDMCGVNPDVSYGGCTNVVDAPIEAGPRPPNFQAQVAREVLDGTCRTLVGIVSWTDTPQGFEFWNAEETKMEKDCGPSITVEHILREWLK